MLEVVVMKVFLGAFTGQTSQGNFAIGGTAAGQKEQGASSIAIGHESGLIKQGTEGVAGSCWCKWSATKLNCYW